MTVVTSAIGDLLKGQGSILSESALIKARMLRAGTLYRYVNATYSQHEKRAPLVLLHLGKLQASQGGTVTRQQMQPSRD